MLASRQFLARQIPNKATSAYNGGRLRRASPSRFTDVLLDHILSENMLYLLKPLVSLGFFVAACFSGSSRETLGPSSGEYRSSRPSPNRGGSSSITVARSFAHCSSEPILSGAPARGNCRRRRKRICRKSPEMSQPTETGREYRNVHAGGWL
jgi:hypothetical protein